MPPKSEVNLESGQTFEEFRENSKVHRENLSGRQILHIPSLSGTDFEI